MYSVVKTLQYSLFACLLAGAMVMSGCDSNDDDDDGGNGGGNLGSATVEITGEGIDVSYTGIAWFGEAEDEESGETEFIIWLAPTQTSTTSNVVAFYRNGSRPGTDGFDLVDVLQGEPEAGEFGALVLAESTVFWSSDGTLTISNSSSTRVAGSFSFTATGVSQTGSQFSVTVEGTFNAVGAPVGIPFPM